LKGSSMDSEWRTIQIFLDEEMAGVFEVQVSSHNSKKLACSCNAYSTSSKCKHVRYVKNAMDNNHGHYAIQIPASAADDSQIDNIDTAEDWRNFVVKYAKVVVL